MLDFLNNNSVAVQAFSTVILTLVTAYYAYETHKSVKIISEQKKDNILPMISFESMSILGHSRMPKKEYYCVECILKNLGNGPALRVVMGFIGGPEGNSESVSRHFIDFIDQKGSHKIHIHIPKKDFDIVSKKTKVI